MSETTTLLALGLATSPNELGATQPGSLVKAQNCVTLAPGLIGPRRGQVPTTATLPTTTCVVRNVFFDGDTPIVSVYDSNTTLYTLYRYDTLSLATGALVRTLTTTVTVTTPFAHGFVAGSVVDVSGADANFASGSFTIASVPSTTTFTYAQSGSNTSSASAYTVTGFMKYAPTGTGFVTTPVDPTVARMRGFEWGGNFYFNTANGVGRIDAKTAVASPTFVGRLQTAGFGVSSLVTSSSGFLAPGYSVAYRFLFGLTDANGIPHLGPPSGRAVFTNTSSSDYKYLSGSMLMFTPTTLTTNHYWRVYRSASTPPDSAGNPIEPSDEMGLVDEGYFTSADLAAFFVAFKDNTPDAARGVNLYTNPESGEPDPALPGNAGVGILQSNYAPPLCLDMASWNERAWYANTSQAQLLLLRLLGTGQGVGTGATGRTGIRLNDIVRIDSTTGAFTAMEFKAGTAYSLAPDYFAVSSSGTATQRIVTTVNSLAFLINTSAQNDNIIATVQSGVDNPPGLLALNQTALNATAFCVSVRPGPVTIAIGQASRIPVVTEVVINTSLDHGLVVGDVVKMAFNAADTGANEFEDGDFTVTVVDDANTFRYDGIKTGAYVSTQAATETRMSPLAATAWSPQPPLTFFAVAVGGLSRAAGTTVTATTSIAHNLVVGNTVYIEPTGNPDPNFAEGSYVVATVPTSTSFTYAESGSNITSKTAYQSGARVNSDPDEKLNGLYFSKIQQPEAVPLVNYLTVGRADKAILRIVPLGDNLFVLKEEGVYIVSGAVQPRVDLLDDTTKIIAADTAVTVGHALYALTNQGVSRITANSVQTVSTNIDQELAMYYGPTLATVKTEAFGVSHETDDLYSLWLPALSGATAAPYNAARAYVYFTLGSSWTTWELLRSCGRVRNSDDYLWMGVSDDEVMAYDARVQTQLAYADGTFAVTVSSWTAATKALVLSSASGVDVGDAIIQSGTAAIVTAKVSNTLTMNTDAFTFTAGAATCARGINNVVRWRTIVANSPADIKQFREVHIHFRTKSFATALVYFQTDSNTAQSTATVSTASYTLATATPVYSGMPVFPKQVRLTIPSAQQRASYIQVEFNITEAYSEWTMNGITLVWESGSERTSR